MCPLDILRTEQPCRCPVTLDKFSLDFWTAGEDVVEGSSRPPAHYFGVVRRTDRSGFRCFSVNTTTTPHSWCFLTASSLQGFPSTSEPLRILESTEAAGVFAFLLRLNSVSSPSTFLFCPFSRPSGSSWRGKVQKKSIRARALPSQCHAGGVFAIVDKGAVVWVRGAFTSLHRPHPTIPGLWEQDQAIREGSLGTPNPVSSLVRSQLCGL